MNKKEKKLTKGIVSGLHSCYDNLMKAIKDAGLTLEDLKDNK